MLGVEHPLVETVLVVVFVLPGVEHPLEPEAVLGVEQQRNFLYPEVLRWWFHIHFCFKHLLDGSTQEIFQDILNVFSGCEHSLV